MTEGAWSGGIVNESDPRFVQFVREAASAAYSTAVGQPTHEVYVVLASELKRRGMESAPYWWYIDLRRFGTTPHAGFGLGFERMLMWMTGMKNIRDAIPFPRTPGQAGF